MTKGEALNVLIAPACCSTAELTCEDCPLFRGVGDEIAPIDARDNHLTLSILHNCDSLIEQKAGEL